MLNLGVGFFGLDLGLRLGWGLRLGVCLHTGQEEVVFCRVLYFRRLPLSVSVCLIRFFLFLVQILPLVSMTVCLFIDQIKQDKTRQDKTRQVETKQDPTKVPFLRIIVLSLTLSYVYTSLCFIPLPMLLVVTPVYLFAPWISATDTGTAYHEDGNPNPQSGEGQDGKCCASI
jgi:hypothetical protein